MRSIPNMMRRCVPMNMFPPQWLPNARHSAIAINFGGETKSIDIAYDRIYYSSTILMGTHLWKCIKGIPIMIVLHQYHRQRLAHNRNINEITRVRRCSGKQISYLFSSFHSHVNWLTRMHTHTNNNYSQLFLQRQLKSNNTVEIIGHTELVRI